MTLQRFAKWWSLASLLVVVAIVAMTYVAAHADGRLPMHHPWPAISVISLAVIPVTVTEGRKSWLWVYKVALSAFAVALAITVNQIM